MAKVDSQMLVPNGVSEVDDIEYMDRPPKMGSRADLRDMKRLGKQQEFSRNFGFLPLVGFSAVIMSTWLGQIATTLSGTANGGLANFIWVYLAVFACWCTVIASMAEMASMAPTSGGQYHWVSEFAPPRISRILSYMTGWSCIFAWQMAFSTIASGLTRDIQSLLILTGSDLQFQNWHASLLTIAVAALAVLFNTNAGNSLPLIGGSFIILYICAFFAFLIPLWVLAPRTDIEEVFLSFSDRGDPGGIAHSLLFGVLAPMYSLMAPDASIHMAEEVKDSSLVLPRAMMTVNILNGILGFVSLITCCFTVGNINAILSSDVAPHIQVLFNTTNSTTTTVGMVLIIDILRVSVGIASLTSASRQLFAFARDKGVPYSAFLTYIRPGWNVPLNAILTSFGLCVIVSLINIGSSIVISTMISISVSGNISSCLITIACLRLKRWRNEPLPSARWSLGRLGGPLNDIAIVFLLFVFVLYFVPSDEQVNADNMNYSIVVWVSVVIFSISFYYFKGRHVYTSPVTLIKKDV